MIRKPAVAGQFYPDDKTELERMVDSYLSPTDDVSVAKERSLGILAPHAGYRYSGRVAGAVYRTVEPPETAIILCPNHTGRGERIAVWQGDGWQTPLGTVLIDHPLTQAIVDASPLARFDDAAHEQEHAIEVHLPFLQRINRQIQLVAIVLSTHHLDEMRRLGQVIANAVRAHKRSVLLIASSDMTHYESQADAEAKDRLAIDEVLALDEARLLEVVAAHQISMCGFAPTGTVIAASKALGSTRAALQLYQTSGDAGGDYEQVVGYAGITFH